MVPPRPRNLLDEIEGDALSGDASIADTLRKVIALGGQVGSTELREWASLELRGYARSELELPDYRKPVAVILINATRPGTQISGQQISPRSLPEGVRQHVGEEVPLTQPIAEIETMVDQAKANGGYLSLALPRSQDVVALMNHEINEPYQQITSVYWSVSVVALQGVIDRVKTTLVELIAEIRAATPDASEAPSAAVADQAVSLVVHGRGARINVAQASGSGSHEVRSGAAPDEGGFPWRKIGAAVVGLATIAGAVFALAQWQGWGL